MQAKTLIAAAVLGFTASAFAQEAGSDAWMTTAATLSRAEVMADLQQARASGLTKAWSAGYIERLGVSKTRAEVVAATIAARTSGEIDAMNAEAHAFSAQPVAAGVRLAKSAR